MKYRNIHRLKKLFKKKGGLVRASEVTAANIPQRELKVLIDSGTIEQVSRGLYRLVDHDFSNGHDIALASKLMPHGVICLISALRFHELGTQYSHAVWLALRQGQRPIQMEAPSISLVRFSESCMTEGIETHTLEGVSVQITSAARTVADCFKFRNRIGLEIAMEALNEYWRYRKERGYTMDDLTRAAKIARVNTVMTPYLEMMIS